MNSFLIKKQRQVFVNKDTVKTDKRLVLVLFIFIIFAGAIFSKLIKLQIIDKNYYQALASGQHEIFKQLFPQRGTIYVKTGISGEELYPLATNKDLNLVFAVPAEIEDPNKTLDILIEVFNLKENSNFEGLEGEELLEAQNKEIEKKEIIEDWREKVNKSNDPYEPLKHRVEDSIVEKIKSYNLSGIRFSPEKVRFYPEKNIASQLLGYVGYGTEKESKGHYGLEGYYNEILGGEAGFMRMERDSLGRLMTIGDNDLRQAEDGSDLILTIDKAIQYYACNELNKAVEEYEAIGGSVIILEPKTGAILAMCNNPDFDPNNYNQVEDISSFNNPSLLDSYEPGSIFKPITMASGLDLGKVTPFTTYNDTGIIYIDNFTIENSDKKANGIQTMTQVLEKSLNTGTIFIADQVGHKEFKRYVEAFGFGEKTGIDLAPEDVGNIASLNKNGDIYLYTGSFGQGLTVTPIQMLNAFSAIVNDGQLMTPYIVKEINYPNGKKEEIQPKLKRQVISKKTADLLKSMLVSVVESGHATEAQVDGYLVGGKTGTAQVPDLDKGGYSSETIHSFIGFAPLNNPRFSMIVKLDHPKAVQFAASSSAVVFAKIAKFILNYYNVSPDTQ